MRRILLPLLALPASACHVARSDHVEVDGVRLPARHEEVLTLASWPDEGLVIEAVRGDLVVETGPGPATLTVLVHERSPGEAHAQLEGGRLVARASEGTVCAIGRVSLRTPGPIGALELSTGMGDVRVAGVGVTGTLSLSTGMGDVSVKNAGAPPDLALSSGMGDIHVAELTCERLSASTGMGDVSVRAVESGELELSSGLGDVAIHGSKGRRVKAETGLGDVDLEESSFSTRELETGLGRVREH